MAEIIEISDLSGRETEIFHRLNEVQLLRYFEPEDGIFIAESPKVIERALGGGYEPMSFLMERQHIDGEMRDILERCGDVPVYTADSGILSEISGFRLTRGALCAMRRRALPSAEEVCRGASRIAVLENVMNPTNVGAIFRSAAALGMDAVLLTDGCSDPLYRRSARVSMGTFFQIQWTYFDGKMDTLKKMGFVTAALALTDNSTGIDNPEIKSAEKLAAVLGTEGDGLSPETVEACDYTVKIPMYHGVDSLNVAAASAVAFWELGKRL